jgi:hypothetical protein
MMFPRIVEVDYVEAYQLKLIFDTGEQGQLDFKDRIMGRGGVFSALENTEFFSQVKVDPEIGTIVWPNDVDFCPDMLYSEVTGKSLPMQAEMA